MKKIRLFALAAFLSFLAASSCVAATLDDQINNQKKILNQVNKRIESHTRELAQVDAKKKGYLSELSVFDQRLQQSEEQIALVNLQIRKNESELQAVTENIQKHNERIKQMQELLAQRCVSIYKYGGVADLNVYLSADDLTELNNLTYLMNRLSREDEKNIRALEAEKLAMQEDELKLQKTQEELGQQFKQRERDRDANKQAAARRRELLTKIEKERQAHLDAMREDEEAQRELQKKINDFLRQKQAEQQASSKAGVKPAYTNSGKFAWPVPERRITSKFGTRVHPTFKIKKKHDGIDIASPQGTPIKAAAAGEVWFAGWQRGFGQVVIIYHGSNYVTVYGHMSKISVEKGDNVKRGSVIGNVGQTGVATGPHLHFEVRLNGVAKDPLKYLGK